MAHLPTDIVADILSRLPVEPILRFRSVSKYWCDLIDSPYFTKLHLKRSIDNRKLLLVIRAFTENSSLYSVTMDSSSSLLDAAVKLDDHPCSSGPEVWGSCDGLILLRNRENHDLSIWNPSIKKHRILPPPMCMTSSGDDIQTSPDYITENFYGFGYDSVHDDYKVVNITQFPGPKNIDLNKFHSQVQVYSLKTNSWTKIVTDLPHYLNYLISAGSYGALVSGALYWAANGIDDGTDCCIVAFDLATMDNHIVPMPAEENLFDFDMELSSFEGRLCLSCVFLDDPCDVWVMKDYGVKESWTKLFSFDPGSLNSFYTETPLFLSKDGTKVLLLQNYRNLIWYDIKHKLFHEVHIHGFQDISYDNAEICVQSLVPLPPNTV